MTIVIIGLIMPLLGTMLGSSLVFFMRRDIPDRLQKTLLGFASGVMVAASFWSLLLPAINMEAGDVLPAALGFLLGMGFLLLIDELTPHLQSAPPRLKVPVPACHAPPCSPSPSLSTTCPKVWL